MEEIRLTTWDVQHPVNNGINYQLQLVSRISSINHITLPFQNKCWVQSLDISKTYWREVWRPFERPMFPDFMHVKWSKAVSFQLQLYTYSIHNCIYSYQHDEAYLCSHLQYIYIYIPRKSKDQTLPMGSRESFIWIILKTSLCLADWTSRVYIFLICVHAHMSHISCIFLSYLYINPLNRPLFIQWNHPQTDPPKKLIRTSLWTGSGNGSASGVKNC